MSAEYWSFIGGLLGSMVGSSAVALQHLRSQRQKMLEKQQLAAAADCIEASNDYIEALESALQHRDDELYQKVLLQRRRGRPS